LLFSIFCVLQGIQAQTPKPVYVSFSFGTDQNTEKSNRILTSNPHLLSLSIEKRLVKSQFYGLGLYAHHFTSIYDNYNHFSLRGYQHFGEVSETSGGNFDPYIGALIGGETFESTFKPAVGIFVGLRIMLMQSLGVHAELSSISSGFNNSVLLQFGITTCILRNSLQKIKSRGTKCPKF
jgi:hypothetical protein